MDNGNIANNADNLNENQNIDEQDKYEKYKDKVRESSDILIPLIILLIFIVFIGWMLYLLISSQFESTNTQNANLPITTTCPQGQCGTNLISGDKICPDEDNPIITIDPTQQVCNSPFVCDNNLTPYALQSDGNIDFNGICQEGVECPCLRNPQCADYILTTFTVRNGNPYSTFGTQRISFPQSSEGLNPDGNNTNQPPIRFNNISTTFCSVPFEWLAFSTPGCNFVSNPNEINSNDLLACMGLPLACDGVTGNPCLQGTLAYITDNSENVNINTIFTNQLSCVSGEPCPCGLIAIYDTNYGGIICKDINS